MVLFINSEFISFTKKLLQIQSQSLVMSMYVISLWYSEMNKVIFFCVVICYFVNLLWVNLLLDLPKNLTDYSKKDLPSEEETFHLIIHIYETITFTESRTYSHILIHIYNLDFSYLERVSTLLIIFARKKGHIAIMLIF